MSTKLTQKTGLSRSIDALKMLKDAAERRANFDYQSGATFPLGSEIRVKINRAAYLFKTGYDAHDCFILASVYKKVYDRTLEHLKESTNV